MNGRKEVVAMRRILIGLAVLLLLVLGWALQMLWASGAFKSLEPHFAGRCLEVSGIVGPEDITIHPRTGVAYISSYDRRAVPRKPGRGAIYAYDLESSRPQLVNLTPDADSDFRPHGIFLHVDEKSGDVLYVINHSGGKHTIEVFDFADGLLHKRMTLEDPLLVSPNDLAAVGRDRLYITNDHGHPEGFMRSIEEFGRLSLSNVVHFDGSQFSVAADRIAYANGINLSPDGRTVYVASPTGRAVHVYDRDPDSDRLSFVESIDTASGVDNIEVDRDGNLWIGSHPKLLQFMAHAEDPAELSPSQVLRISRDSEGRYAVNEVYLDLGEQLSASSVAAVRGSRLLIGGIFDPRFLDCRFE
jgi:arylesterase/paraoxonase